jgi:iron complex transport system ATP-binding protein
LLDAPDRPAVVTVTHHLEELPRQVETILLLGGGQVIASGTPESVLTELALSAAYAHRVRIREDDGRFRLELMDA